jgi:hypothetical protein
MGCRESAVQRQVIEGSVEKLGLPPNQAAEIELAAFDKLRWQAQLQDLFDRWKKGRIAVRARG